MIRGFTILALALTLLLACNKEDSPAPCLSSPVPYIDLNSWPMGLHQDSTWVVSYDSLLLDMYVIADGSYTQLSAGVPAEPRLTSVNISIVATANDSTLYATTQDPDNFHTTINTLATIGTVTTNTPAELRISVGNSCSGSNSVVRALLITP
ncbi:MAG TPA: hypothetical protein PKN30_04800 [Flavobacteriales bacterium]|nr:hypothetical protein [Flavobacteriales bacterium]